ncbi:MAG TPA: hypothetical protein VKQ32_09065, partial [Polyangia bacterium]|nr:hypothetical protein [Polyangia bacterium]
MKVQSAFLALAIAFGMISGGCSSGTGGAGTGGSSSGGAGPGTGGTTGSGGTGPSCQNVSPCGGSVDGTWTVMSSCLTVNGTVDPSWLGLDPRTCNSVSISGSLSVSGTFTAAGGTYTDATHTTGTPRLDLAAGCLMLSGTKVDCAGIQRTISGATCASATGGGCTCTLTVDQMGGIGVISNGPSKSDHYATAGNVVTLTTDAGNENYAYCVAGSQMTWTPQSATLPIMGTIVLATAGGTGGTTGAGGAAGTGGTTGAGGAGGTGGSSAGAGGSSTGGRGGTMAAAGASGTAGRGGAGGTGGGAAGRGGTTGTG